MASNRSSIDCELRGREKYILLVAVELSSQWRISPPMIIEEQMSICLFVGITVMA